MFSLQFYEIEQFLYGKKKKKNKAHLLSAPKAFIKKQGFFFQNGHVSFKEVYFWNVKLHLYIDNGKAAYVFIWLLCNIWNVATISYDNRIETYLIPSVYVVRMCLKTAN